jgi:hypothetical protein
MDDAFLYAWSYSSLKNYETCPKRYGHYNVLKDVVEPETAQLAAGNALHKHFENRVLHGPEKGRLPLGYGQFEKILSKFTALPGTTYGEQKLALTASFEPVAFFGKGVWFRTVIDFAKINGDFALIADWKDGKVKEDTTQLQLMAATIFAADAGIQRVRAALVFVNNDELKREEFVREDVPEIWSEILPRVRAMQRARKSQEFPPKPSGLCKKYCAVVSCPYHGK